MPLPTIKTAENITVEMLQAGWPWEYLKRAYPSKVFPAVDPGEDDSWRFNKNASWYSES